MDREGISIRRLPRPAVKLNVTKDLKHWTKEAAMEPNPITLVHLSHLSSTTIDPFLANHHSFIITTTIRGLSLWMVVPPERRPIPTFWAKYKEVMEAQQSSSDDDDEGQPNPQADELADDGQSNRQPDDGEGYGVDSQSNPQLDDDDVCIPQARGSFLGDAKAPSQLTSGENKGCQKKKELSGFALVWLFQKTAERRMPNFWKAVLPIIQTYDDDEEQWARTEASAIQTEPEESLSSTKPARKKPVCGGRPFHIGIVGLNANVISKSPNHMQHHPSFLMFETIRCTELDTVPPEVRTLTNLYDFKYYLNQTLFINEASWISFSTDGDGRRSDAIAQQTAELRSTTQKADALKEE
ncbi:hypothetical protein F5Y06DRAFT_297500 [Hypoxylon sp. FL0890]|nr:hypothetical protein F5Y06DRAFT_297500 [Hypoxylon sp. FL0890]